MPITKATQNVISPNIVTTDTVQTITSPKVILQKYNSTSSTSVTIGTGSKSLTIGTGLYFIAGDGIVISRTGFSQKMEGTVTSYNSSTGALVANISTTSGSGTYSSWAITNDPNTALPAIRITQDGSGSAILVEDSANPDATPFAVSSTGSVLVGGRINGSNTINGTVTRLGGLSVYTFNTSFTSPGETSGGLDISDLVSSVSFGTVGKVYAQVDVAQIFTDSTPNVYWSGGYEGDVAFNSTTNTSGGVSYSVNNTTGYNFATAYNTGTGVIGYAQKTGNLPGNGYASFNSTNASGSTNGLLTLTMRGHTASNGANFSYVSFVRVTILSPS